MTFLHGKGSELLVDGADLSAYFEGADISADVDTAEVTTFKADWKSFLAGVAAGSLEAQGVYDPGLVAIKDTLLASSNAVITLSPGKATALNDAARLIAPVSVTYKESAPVGDKVAFQWTAQADAGLGFGRIWHPLGTETATATSNFVDGGAASTDGAVAHLHVTALDGDTTLDVHFEDATTGGGAYSAISGGAFAQATGVGAERLVIPGTIRRYVKATWTIAGSAPSVTFAVMLARN